MSRAPFLSDSQISAILKALNQEIFARYTNPKEKAAAEDAARAVLDTPWVPECPVEISLLPPDQFAALQSYLAGAD